MHRAVHIAITLMMVLLLVRPFDCLAGLTTPKAADCCAKGKCLPTRGADECCKATPPSGIQFVVAKPSHASSIPALRLFGTVAGLAVRCHFVSSARASFHRPVSSPGSPPDFNRNLPLLI